MTAAKYRRRTAEIPMERSLLFHLDQQSTAGQARAGQSRARARARARLRELTSPGRERGQFWQLAYQESKHSWTHTHTHTHTHSITQRDICTQIHARTLTRTQSCTHKHIRPHRHGGEGWQYLSSNLLMTYLYAVQRESITSSLLGESTNDIE